MSEQAQELKITSFRIPRDLHKRFKIAAAKDEKSMEAVVVGLIEAYVRREEKLSA